jgi:V8-like Glu-specific endopeptidase
MLSSCSGFLVSPDILVTAWHCLKDKTDCKKNLWLLDYNESQSVFSKNQIVYCKEIIDSKASVDYALVRLSKPVLDRKPLKLRRSGKVNKEAKLTVIGHPLGLPKVVTDQAFLQGNILNNTFTILSDTYSGNSGSPVIDTKTSLVEGMLTKGDRDFEMDFNNQCYRSAQCNEQWCKGETILRSVLIPILH